MLGVLRAAYVSWTDKAESERNSIVLRSSECVPNGPPIAIYTHRLSRIEPNNSVDTESTCLKMPCNKMAPGVFTRLKVIDRVVMQHGRPRRRDARSS